MTPDDDSASASPAVVISHGFWRRRFGLDSAAIGKPVVLNGTLPATIVGVTPPDFQVGRGGAPDFIIPLALGSQLMSDWPDPENWKLGVLGRMKAGIGIGQVRSNLQGLFEGFVLEEAPTTAPADMPRLEVFSAAQGFSRDNVREYMRPSFTRYQLLLILTAAGCVLLVIVGLNVANLLIARAAARQYEIGVRLAIGAGRGRLIRQLLTESVTLALMGGLAGVLVAYSGKDLLRLFLQQDMRSVLIFRIDQRVLVFCALVSLVTGIFFGIAPALRATRTDVSSVVKPGSRAAAGSRALAGRTLLIIQVAMSVVLLVGAGWLLRTVGNLPGTNIGFDADHLLAFRVNVEALRNNRIRYEQLIDSIRAVSGVQAVTTSSDAFIGQDGSFSGPPAGGPLDGQPAIRVSTIRVHTVRGDFFETLGIPVVRGRTFDRSDGRDTQPVAIVTESIARLATSDALGWKIDSGIKTPLAMDKIWEIVGVVKNVGVSEVGRDLEGTVFFLESQQPSLMPVFDVRTTENPMTTIAAIRDVLRRVDPNLRASQVSTETERVRQKLAPTRYIAIAWAAFGGVALLLTSIGLYGLLSHSVSQRTHEIGIRMALGARRVHVVRMMMAKILILVFIGLSAGLGLSFAANALMRALIYGVSLNDTTTFLVVAVIMLVVTTFAGYLPARRAMRIDPTVALRHE